jgi:3-deoxy-manno-octulosonate cytidylyltransferase (CMP-KDO synthetase)
MASTRLPGKMLTDVGGVPLVVCTWRSVVASGLFDRVTIAAADAEIVEIARAHGAEVLRTGPAPSGTHRVSCVVDDHSVVVNVQGDMPLVGSDALGAALAALSAHDIGTVCAPLAGDPHAPERVKVSRQQGRAVDFSRSPFGVPHLQHVGVYAFRPGAIRRAIDAPISSRCMRADLEQLAWLDSGLTMGAVEIACAPFAIDLPHQLEHLRSRVRQGLVRLPPVPTSLVYAVRASS